MDKHFPFVSIYDTLHKGGRYEGIFYDQELEAVYQRRYEEGFNVYDSDYVGWLEINHPEPVPDDRYNLNSTQKLPNPHQLHHQKGKSVHCLLTLHLVLTAAFPSFYCHFLTTPSRPSVRKSSAAQVLTSTECLVLLEEKEEKKRKNQEGMEKRS